MANKFLVWIESSDYVMSQTQFESLTDRITGFKSGEKARSANVNAGMRQANLVAAALMNVISPDSQLDLSSSLDDTIAEMKRALPFVVQSIDDVFSVRGTNWTSSNSIINALAESGRIDAELVGTTYNIKNGAYSRYAINLSYEGQARGEGSAVFNRKNVSNAPNASVFGNQNYGAGIASFTCGLNNDNRGQDSFVGGQSNTLYDGTHNLLFGSSISTTAYTGAQDGDAHNSNNVLFGTTYKVAENINFCFANVHNSSDYTNPLFRANTHHSAAFGQNIYNLGNFAFFVGSNNTSNGSGFQFVRGQANNAKHYGCSLIGQGLVSTTDYVWQTIVGQYNDILASNIRAAFVVGAGAGTTSRQNAFSVIARIDESQNAHVKSHCEPTEEDDVLRRVDVVKTYMHRITMTYLTDSAANLTSEQFSYINFDVVSFVDSRYTINNFNLLLSSIKTYNISGSSVSTLPVSGRHTTDPSGAPSGHVYSIPIHITATDTAIRMIYLTVDSQTSSDVFDALKYIDLSPSGTGFTQFAIYDTVIPLN